MRSKLLAPVLFGCFVSSFWASSARAEEPVTTETSTGSVQPSLSSNAIHLDLTSVDRTATAGHLAAEGLEILVGETVRQLSSTSMLTPAEKLAAYQVFSAQTQTIILGAQGNAVGGTFTMGERFTNYVSGLVIPEGVVASRDFGTTSALQLTGPLINAGTLMASSSNAAVTAALISASSIVNQSTGLIASMAGTANGVGLDLHLTARGDIINFGTIASAGNLSLSAGGAIVNGPTTTPAVASIISAMSNAIPTLLAHGNLVLNSSNIVNRGLIESLNGNVQSALNTTQVLSSDTGLMQALQGTISLGTASVLSSSPLNVLGGTFRATDIDLIAGGGNGKLRVEVEQLDGTVHTAGSYARVGVQEGALLLGNIQIAGDPTYFNSAVNGDIQISGNISVEEALSIIASRNITTTAAVTLIQARSAAGQGFDINFLAGANITTGAGSTSSINTTPPLAGSAISPVTVSGASATGGNVDFTASPLLSINASSTCANCSGGNVVIAAYANGAGSGFIKLPPQTSPTQLGSTVNASGFGTGNNGSVTMLAGGTVGETIQTGAVFTRLGTGGLNGNISLATAQPVTSDGNALVFGTDGRISSGNFLRAGASQAGASININNNLIASGLVDIQAGAHITTTPGVVATVPVGPSSSFGAGFKFLGQGVALNNAGSTAYVANLLDNSITVIRTSDNVVTDTIQLGPPNPGGIFITAAVLEGLEVTPDDKYLIASSIFGDNALGALYVIDTTNNTVVNQIDSDVFHLYPACVTIDSTGKYAYVSNEGLFDPSVLVAASNLSVIDIDAAINNPGSALVSTVDLGVDPFQSTLTPDGRFLYTLNALGSLPPTISAPTVSVIDTQLALTDPANAVVATITLPSLPTVEFGALSIAMHPSGNRVYVSNADTNSLQVIDTATNQIVGNVGVGTQPGGVAIERGGTFLFSMNSNASNGYSTLANGSMSIVRTGDNTTVAEVPLGLVPLMFTNNFLEFSNGNLLVSENIGR